ncbi:MAG: hypothetical protein V3569_03340 [Acholeplasmataceae bacterium]|nr:hypothetical protein [Acholeplasmataceae bacterium]
MTKKFDEYQVVGIIGLAKNTGKTTTLNWLIKKHLHETIGLTSIGLDGEKMDQIHFLPKPRIMVHQGMIVATAKSCLDESTIKYDLIEQTNLFTSIGEILIVRIKNEGFLVIAGPTTNRELSIVLKTMKQYTSKIFIDGALNRMTFSHIDEIDGLVLSTGASVSPIIEETVEKTKRIVDLFSLHKTSDYISIEQFKILIMTNRGDFYFEDKKISSIETILNDHSLEIHKIIIKGAITENLIDTLIQSRRTNYELVGEDPSRFIFQSNKLKYLDYLNVNMTVEKPLKLILLTINPYRPTLQSYDSDIFMKALKDKINMEIIDVMREE